MATRGKRISCKECTITLPCYFFKARSLDLESRIKLLKESEQWKLSLSFCAVSAPLDADTTA
eukprot:scaffold2117_cov245-Chaetoceros_neogracile.AAC.5